MQVSGGEMTTDEEIIKKTRDIYDATIARGISHNRDVKTVAVARAINYAIAEARASAVIEWLESEGFQKETSKKLFDVVALRLATPHPTTIMYSNIARKWSEELAAKLRKEK
jgi:hypothetical protein